jgi:osmotically-inducible protein OsmY
MDISVTVHQKVVHLSGVVDSSADVAKAEALARAVRGVSAVTNAIRVASRPTRA